MRWILPCAVVGLVLMPRSAHTQPAAAAEKAFEEGRAFMAEGRYAEACERFAESQRLDPGVGTLLNLGDCYEKLGRTASAWSTFREAFAAANRANQTGRATEAKKRADALEPNLTMLRLSVAETVPSLVIELDGVEISALIGTEIPVDPGSHRVVARAPNHREWKQTIDIAARGSKSLTIPPLAELPKPPPPEQPKTRRRMTPLSWALAGTGVVALGIGIGLNASAYSTVRECRSDGQCESQSQVDGIRTRFIIGDTLIGVGIAGGIGAALLYWMSDEPTESAVSIDLSSGVSASYTARF